MQRIICFGIFVFSLLSGADAWSAFTASPNPSTTGKITLAWDNSSSGNNYRVTESLNGGDANEVYSGTVMQFLLSGRVGGSYVYELQSEFCYEGYCQYTYLDSVTVTVSLTPEAAASSSADRIALFDSTSYDIYYGDVNEDNNNDLYFHPKDKIILLHGDIITPIILPKAQGFIISNVEYSNYAQTQIIELTESEITAKNLTLATENTDYFYGDFNGDGINDVIVSGSDNESPSFEILGTSSVVIPAIEAVFEANDAPAGFNISNRNVRFTVVDANGDGADDLIYYSGSVALSGYLSDGGQLSYADGLDFTLGTKITAIGATPGGHNVSSDGSASYGITIAAPEGIAGMQPSVSLSYSSSAGDGHVGLGWGLGGASSIQRCDSNYDFGGDVDGVDFDSNDHFCLDGEPLVAVNGLYGAPGTEYTTRAETFSKITSHGQVGNCVRNGVNVKGPEKFSVRTASGQTFEYGYTSDSRVEANGCGDVLRWAINKNEDRFGNSIHYHYAESAYDHYITSIDYNAGESRITFDYEDRVDANIVYYAGSKTQQTKLLKKISSFEGSAVLREYHLDYEFVSSSSVSRLTSLTECSATECLAPTEFTWTDGSTSSSMTYDQRIASTICENSDRGVDRCNDNDNHNYIYHADINGDALSDVCYRSDFGIYCRLGTESGFSDELIATTICANGSAEHGICDSSDIFDTIAFVDVDADGMADLTFVSYTGLRVLRSTGSGFEPFIETSICAHGSTANGGCYNEHHARSLSFTDVNGDGLVDVCYRGQNGVHCFKGTGSDFDGGHISTSICNSYNDSNCDGSNNYDFIRYVDINADGKADLVVRTDLGVYVWRSTGTDFVLHMTSTICGDSSSDYICNNSANSNNIQFPDINGDGVADICYRGDRGLSCKIGTGYSWEGGDIVTGICAQDSPLYGECDGSNNFQTIQYADLNQDGRADILYRSDRGMYAFKSTGTGFSFLFHKPGICDSRDDSDGYCHDPGNYSTIQVTDFNGDGLPDLVYRGDQGIQLWPLNVDQQNLMTKVTNGFGVETKFNYKLMTDSSVYTKGVDYLAFPAQHLIHTGKLVSSVESSDGIGGYSSMSYTYKDLQIHHKGLGVLGFKEMTTTNDETGISVQTIYNMDYAQRSQGHAEEIITTAENGTVLLHTELKFDLVTWDTGDSYRYQLRPISTTSIEHDLNGAFLQKTVSTLLDFDEYGSPRQSIDEVFKNETDEDAFSTATVDYEYNHGTPENFFLGRIVRTTSTSFVAGRSDRIKTATWAFDPMTSRMTVARIHLPDADLDPDNDVILHETYYGLDENGAVQVDEFGNNLAITIKGPDFVSRTSKIAFDATGRRVISKTNALGFSIATDYYSVSDTSSGAYPYKVKAVTGVNAQKIATKYDSFGRVTTMSSAYGTPFQNDATTQFKTCDNSCPSAAIYYIATKTEGGAEGRSYLDKLGRKLLQKSQVIKKLNQAATWVNVAYRYDQLGRAEVSAPYFDGETTAYWTDQEYDDLGRVTKVTRPDGRVDKTAFNGLTVTTYTDTQGKNQSNKAEKNVLGELIKVTDNNNQAINYSYDAHGNLLSSTGPDNDPIVLTYDKLGRKIEMNDPDKDVWKYTYNGLGQLITQTNARGEVICNAYDILGRNLKRIDNYQGALSTAVGQVSESTNQCAGDAGNSELATWTYDTATGAALGKPHKVFGQDGFESEVIYDTYGRAVEAITTINGESYSTETNYDALGRPNVTTYPGASNRLQLRNTYNQLGMLSDVRDANSGTLYYQVDELDARGNVTSEIFGNGVKTTRAYRDDNGRLISIGSGIGLPGSDAQNLGFTFDALGNLDYRQDFKNGFREDFVYDSNNRLITNTANFGNGDIRTTDVTYDVYGNIRTKSGVGSYKYGDECATGFGPHAVCEITGTKNAIYTYDLNGNMLGGDGRSMEYTVFDKPDHIVKGNNITDITYGPTRSRYFRRDTVDVAVTEYTYVGGIYEKVDFKNDGVAINKTEERHFIGGFAVLTIEGRTAQAAGTAKTRYLHKDHIGSTTAITDEIGNVVEEFSFDPWGKRRATSLDELEFLHGSWLGLTNDEKNNLTTDPSELSSFVTNRGFTGHEQMDPVGLIHMNGRVYDAEIGRFIQADPVLQAPTDLQSYNRFSYVRNNPLSLVDPSGYSWLSKQYKRAKKRLVQDHQSGLKTNIAHLLHKAIDNETNRATIRVHQWNQSWSPGLRETDEYLGTHDWVITAVVVIVAIVTEGEPLAMAIAGAVTAMAAAKHRVFLKGGDANDMRRSGQTAFITSVVSSGVGGYVNAVYESAAVNFATQIAAGYVIQGAANRGHFGSFKDYMKGWAKSAAATFALRHLINGSGSGGGSGCEITPNPINIATGEKYLTMKDYQATGASLLKFERYYSSLAKGKTSLGFGWRSNFDNQLLFNAKNPENISQVKALRSRGETINFSLSEKNEWQAAANYESLERNSSGWTLTLTNNRTEHYDMSGRLIRISDLGGYEQVLHYAESGDNAGQLVSVTDSFNQELRFEYNDNGLLSALIASDATLTRYEYDRFSSLEKVISSTESIAGVVQQTYKQYLHEDTRFVHSITGIVNHAGERIHTMAYDERGRAVLSELGDHAERAEIVFHNDRRSTVTNSLGKTTTYTFNDDNKPLKVEGHASASCIASNQGYDYDDNGLLLSKTDWSGSETRYQYNDRGLETVRIEAVGTEQETTVSTKWHKQWRLPVKVERTGKTEKFKYNDKGLLVRRTEIDTQSQRKVWQRLSGNYSKRTWAYEYNNQNLLAHVDGPRDDVNDVTQFSYDAAGNRTAVENALGHRVETTAFNTRGLPLTVKDANGVEIHLTYNKRGWLTSKAVAGPEGEELTQYTYTGMSDYAGEGLVKSATLPNGNVIHYEYDSARRLTAEVNGLGERVDYTLDLEGNRLATAVYSSNGELERTQGQVFDELSRVLKSIGVNGATTTYHYDKAGRRIGITDPLGNKTAYAYDALNRLVATTDASGVVGQGYNALNQLTSVRDQRGLVTEYRYNGFGDKIAQISPDTGTTLFEYNKAGQPVKVVDARGEVTLYKNDVLGRVSDVLYPAANDENIHYAYDAYESNRAMRENYLVGRLAEIHDSSGSTVYSYNHRGQVTAQDYRIGENAYQIAYNYDRFGALQQTVYPGGRTINYQNGNGRLAQVSTNYSGSSQVLADNFSRAAFGPLQGYRYGNGSELNIRRDQGHRITDIRVTGDAVNDVLYDVGFVYDLASNIESINDSVLPSNSQRFEYDNSYRLIHAKGQYGEINYAYDGVGNRLSRERVSALASPQLESYEYAQDSNRLLSVVSAGSEGSSSSRNLDYDAVGNIISDSKTDNAKVLQYSARNRLAKVEIGDDGLEAHYLYNAKGQRVSKTVGDVVTHFHYDIADRLIAETTLGSLEQNNSREFIYAAGHRIAMVDYSQAESDQLLFVVNDHLGTPQMLLSMSEEVVWQMNASPFGEVDLADSGVKQPLRFPGQYADDETGYSYNYFRDYDASLGRYIQSDPIGLGGGVNTFGYVLANPNVNYDIQGLASWYLYGVRAKTVSQGVFHAQQGVSSRLYGFNSSSSTYGSVVYKGSSLSQKVGSWMFGPAYSFTPASPNAFKNRFYGVGGGIEGAGWGALDIDGAAAIVVSYKREGTDGWNWDVVYENAQALANDTGLPVHLSTPEKSGVYKPTMCKD